MQHARVLPILPQSCTATDDEAIAVAREVAAEEHHPGDWSDAITSVREQERSLPGGHAWTEKSVTMLRREHGRCTIAVVSVQGRRDWETFDALHMDVDDVPGVAEVCARFLATVDEGT